MAWRSRCLVWSGPWRRGTSSAGEPAEAAVRPSAGGCGRPSGGRGPTESEVGCGLPCRAVWRGWLDVPERLAAPVGGVSPRCSPARRDRVSDPRRARPVGRGLRRDRLPLRCPPPPRRVPDPAHPGATAAGAGPCGAVRRARARPVVPTPIRPRPGCVRESACRATPRQGRSTAVRRRPWCDLRGGVLPACVLLLVPSY